MQGRCAANFARGPNLTLPLKDTRNKTHLNVIIICERKKFGKNFVFVLLFLFFGYKGVRMASNILSNPQQMQSLAVA